MSIERKGDFSKGLCLRKSGIHDMQVACNCMHCCRTRPRPILTNQCLTRLLSQAFPFNTPVNLSTLLLFAPSSTCRHSSRCPSPASPPQPVIMASGVDAKLLKSTKFPPEYSKKVDREKVNLEVMKQFVRPANPFPSSSSLP